MNRSSYARWLHACGPIRQAVRARQLHTTQANCAAPPSPSSSRPRGPSVIRDEQIRAQRVRLVDPQTNELMPGPFSTSELLASIDRKRFVLQQVTPGKVNKVISASKDALAAAAASKDDSTRRKEQKYGKARQVDQKTATEQKPEEKAENEIEDDDEDQVYSSVTLEDLPIVKLVDKKEVYDRERAAKRERQQSGATSKSSASLHKEVQFSWHSTQHDVHHKLQPMRTNLIKRGPGATCTIHVSQKKGKEVVSVDEKMALLEEVERYLCDWDADEVKGVLSEEVASNGEGQRTAPNKSSSSNQKPCVARKKGEVEWKYNQRAAMLRIEVVRR